MRRIQVVCFALLLPLILGTWAAAKEVLFEAGPRKVALVELYTSEGCSSCPSADRWVSMLKDDEGLWERFIPIAFHVDYWDHIGWKDKMGSPVFSEKQRVYAQYWGSSSIYTPCFVINAKEWRGWNGHRTVPARSQENVGILRITRVTSREYEIDFRPSHKGSSTWRVHAALLGFDLVSKVGAGENQGKVLHHDFVALAYEEHDMLDQRDHVTTTVHLIAPEEIAAARYGLAVWVTRGSGLVPYQVAGGYLPEN